MSQMTATISIRTDKGLKEKVGKILTDLGLSHSTAINIYYRRILAQQGIPFEVKIPNKETLQAMADLEKGENTGKFSSAEDLFEDLGI